MPDLIDSPASPLATLLSRESRSPELTIVSGPSGAGKTSWCLKLAESARASKLVVGGLISIPVTVDGRQIAIDLVDQVTLESRRLAVLCDGESGRLATEHWCFDPAVLTWGNSVLLELPKCDRLILDELGPLEFVRGQGLQAGLDLIDSRPNGLTCVVVRPQLLSVAHRRWPWGTVLTLSNDDGKMPAMGASR